MTKKNILTRNCLIYKYENVRNDIAIIFIYTFIHFLSFSISEMDSPSQNILRRQEFGSVKMASGRMSTFTGQAHLLQNMGNR